MTNSIVPPPLALRAMAEGTASIVRRIEFYESDGEARWNFSDSDSRFVIGSSITLDYSRDERRMLDLSLLNDDDALRPNPYGGLWYDKVIKVFRGVRYRNSFPTPRIVIVEEATANGGYALRSILMSLGFSSVDVKLSATKFEDIKDYDVVISWRQGSGITKATLLNDAYRTGRKVITNSTSPVTGDLPFATTLSSAASHGGNTTWGATPVNYDVPISMDWSEHTVNTSGGNLITGINGTAIPVGTWRHSLATSVVFYSAILAQNQEGGRWFHYSPANISNSNAQRLWKNAIKWLMSASDFAVWETQVGEFVIDNINEDNFPYQVKVTGRDYTKRCLGSKITRATAWEAGSNGRNIIEAVAANSGIRKMKLPAVVWALPVRLDYAAGTPRWQIMKEIANAFNHDIYFNAQGYLTVTPFQDPVLSPVVARFATGNPDGNLVRYTRSVSDSELYNHIVITSEATNEDSLPFFGEALNTEPDSPTRISKIGDRPFFWSSAALTSDAACRELADSWLKIYALESYDLSFESIPYPWIDVGDIVEIVEPDKLASDPIRFLLSSVTIPLDLGPMSGSARRLTVVADKGPEPEYPTETTEPNPDPNPEEPVPPPPVVVGALYPSNTLYPSDTLYPRG